MLQENICFEVNIICGVYPDGLFRLNTTRAADEIGSCCVSDAFVMRFASFRAYEKSEM